MAGRIILNGRVLRFPLTGVQRYVSELSLRLSDKIKIVMPESVLRGFSGHLWEQIFLPRMTLPNDLLWSPANTGPLSIEDQVVTIHDIGVLDHPEWYSRRFSAWYNFLLPRLINRVKAIITISEFSKSRIVDTFKIPPEKLVVIPNGVGEIFYPRMPSEIKQVAEKYSLPDQYIFSLGTMQPRKNLKQLLGAWELIRVSFPEVKLAIAGEEDRIFRQVHFGRLSEGVLFLGRVNEVDLPALYTGAHLFIYPSLYEGFGLPVLEAMSCGVPVITSRQGALAETVGKAGVLVDAEDVEDIAENIQKLLSNANKRDELRVLGFAQVKNFSWEVISEQTWQFLSSMLEDIS